jgi:hypothetical protein
MRYSTRIFLAATMTASLAAAALPQPASAQFTDAELKCRSAISKGGGKYAKTVQKAITGCHANRDKNGPDSTDCNDVETADIKDKVPAAVIKFDTTIETKCLSGTPSDVLFDDCPSPCDGIDITGFNNLSACLVCLTDANEEAWTESAYGSPLAPMVNSDQASCHKAITKNGSKLFNTVIKAVAKCQSTEEKGGSQTVSDCISNPDFASLTDEAYNKARVGIQNGCEGVPLTSALDPCGGEITVFDMAVCVVDAARMSALELVTQYLVLEPTPTTTTSTSTSTTGEPTTTTTGEPTTTTTLLGTQDPLCPNLGELTLYSKNSNIPCTSNTDCDEPRFCNTALAAPRCETVADLDSGWNGAGHGSDINDQVKTRAKLLCEGPASPGCGECLVTGLDPSSRNCRCANNILTVCDEPLQADSDDCGGNVCNCYFGAPFPLSAQGTPVCVSNKFSADISGTANPDLGSGEISANLRAQVFTGYTLDLPCPVCGGKCSDDQSGCIFDSDCTGNADCVQDVPGDTIRNGVCIRDPDFHTGSGEPCDIDGINANFPAVIGVVPGGGGGGYSIDCQPDAGKNAAGAGLKIALTQTTGISSLGFDVDCNGPTAGTTECPCLVCSTSQTDPCDSNADCALLPGSCSGAPSGGGIPCTSDAQCTGVDIGPCNNINRCTKKTAQNCTSNNDCLNQNVGPCALQTCTAKGTGVTPKPNFCTDTICTDQGGGEGLCVNGPNFLFCDAIVKSDGESAAGCLNNGDCSENGYGLCTVQKLASCFLDPIVASGVPDPEFPIAAATFCIPPASNTAVNSSAGLPGPGRVVSQGAAKTFCASNNAVQYTPGGVPACP